MKKIVLVNASPREKGNCAKAIAILSEQLKDAEVTVFNLLKRDVKPCLGCDFCKTKDTVQCIQKDDMATLLPLLDTCDALVVASPIYFGAPNGPAKNFLDRTYPFFNPTKPNFSIATKVGKKCAIIVTAGSMPIEVITKAAEAYNCFGAAAGFTDGKVLAFNSTKSHDIFSIEEDAKKVVELAAWLAE